MNPFFVHPQQPQAIYTQPQEIYLQPAYQQPAYQQPAYQQPAYQQQPQFLGEGISGGSGVLPTRTIPESTANWIIKEAKAALRDEVTLNLARYLVSEVVEEHTDPSVARYSEMAAIHDFVSSRVRYTSDPFGIELVFGARELVRRILYRAQFGGDGKFAEDCDGFTSLSLALLLSIGHVCQVILAGYTNVEGWQHIFVQDYMPSLGWVTFDPSMKEKVREVMANVDKVKAFPINAHKD